MRCCCHPPAAEALLHGAQDVFATYTTRVLGHAAAEKGPVDIQALRMSDDPVALAVQKYSMVGTLLVKGGQLALAAAAPFGGEAL
eukprot:269212-Chlamydomonas_euryale.AAC.1